MQRAFVIGTIARSAALRETYGHHALVNGGKVALPVRTIQVLRAPAGLLVPEVRPVLGGKCGVRTGHRELRAPQVRP